MHVNKSVTLARCSNAKAESIHANLGEMSRPRLATLHTISCSWLTCGTSSPASLFFLLFHGSFSIISCFSASLRVSVPYFHLFSHLVFFTAHTNHLSIYYLPLSLPDLKSYPTKQATIDFPLSLHSTHFFYFPSSPLRIPSFYLLSFKLIYDCPFSLSRLFSTLFPLQVMTKLSLHSLLIYLISFVNPSFPPFFLFFFFQIQFPLSLKRVLFAPYPLQLKVESSLQSLLSFYFHRLSPPSHLLLFSSSLAETSFPFSHCMLPWPVDTRHLEASLG